MRGLTKRVTSYRELFCLCIFHLSVMICCAPLCVQNVLWLTDSAKFSKHEEPKTGYSVHTRSCRPFCRSQRSDGNQHAGSTTLLSGGLYVRTVTECRTGISILIRTTANSVSPPAAAL